MVVNSIQIPFNFKFPVYLNVKSYSNEIHYQHIFSIGIKHLKR